MENNEKIAVGLGFGISREVELPKELHDFLLLNDQGIEGFEMMLRDEKLFKRIPHNVRIQYEIFLGQFSIEIEQKLNDLKAQLDEYIKNPTPLAHLLIQQLLTNEDEFH